MLLSYECGILTFHYFFESCSLKQFKDIIKVALVEDDADIRKLTASLINIYPDLECIGSFNSAEEFENNLHTVNPDIVLMDIGLPGKSGIECIRDCSSMKETIQYLVYSDHQDSREVYDALAAGANGYVLKGTTPEKLAEAIRDMYQGGSPMSRQISRMVASSFKTNEKKHPDFEKLTPQEWEVLIRLERGLAYKEIAAERFVSEHTVRSQVRSIYEKLHVHTRTEALNKFHNKY